MEPFCKCGHPISNHGRGMNGEPSACSRCSCRGFVSPFQRADGVRERAWAAHLRTKRSHRQARRSSFDAGYDAALAALERMRRVSAAQPYETERELAVALEETTAELAALREAVGDVRKTFHSGDYGALVESVRALLAAASSVRAAADEHGETGAER